MLAFFRWRKWIRPMLYLSDLIGKKILDPQGNTVARITDLVATLPQIADENEPSTTADTQEDPTPSPPPPLKGILARTGRRQVPFLPPHLTGKIPLRRGSTSPLCQTRLAPLRAPPRRPPPRSRPLGQANNQSRNPQSRPRQRCRHRQPKRHHRRRVDRTGHRHGLRRTPPRNARRQTPLHPPSKTTPTRHGRME